MNVSESKTLIHGAKFGMNEVWAEFGCGSGVFTRALGGLLPAGGEIYAFDKVEQNLPEYYKGTKLFFRHDDFTHRDLEMPSLNGILMANSLHYVKRKSEFIQQSEAYFRESFSEWVIVDYELKAANPWVPYPISFLELKKLFRRLGYQTIERIGGRPSKFGGIMYAAFIEK